jgi:GT2 family glycosyltransferase
MRTNKLEENRPLVSIIVRTKDRPKLLKRALQSINEQTYRPIEVVLVNDGGCDLDIEELKTILSEVSLNYIRLEKNTGRAHAGNVGIENAKGEYVGFLDDDDEFYPEHIKILTTFLEQSDYKVAYTSTEMVFQEFAPEEEKMVDLRKSILSKDFSYDDLLVGNYIPFNSILFSKEVINAIDRIDESFELYEDWDFLIRSGEKYPFCHIKKTTCKYSQWSRELQINQANAENMLGMHIKVIKKNMGKITAELILNMKHKKEEAELAFQNLRDRLDIPETALENGKKLLAQKEKVIWELENTVRAADDRAIRLSNELSEKDLQLAQFANRLAEKDSSIAELGNTIGKKNDRIDQLEIDMRLIKDTLGWRTLEVFRKLREKVLPGATKRRRLLNLGLKSVRVLVNEGIKGFYVRAKIRLRRKDLMQLKAKRGIPLSTINTCNPVDIILPVFNGYDYLVPCLESVIRNTDLGVHRLLIIDDKSPDPEIREYLDNFDRDGLKIEILHNDENLGFVKTVNKGMKFSESDVVLLNSDTLVTAGWLEKLQRAAYSRPRIASVTPFSNNAIHCSIPVFLKENVVPDGFTVKSFAAFIDKISLRYYPEIPTAVGFCMYIKRSVLKEIGYFDEETFGKGYGEECDFCARTFYAGYIHILDDATYVYHKGSVSFLPEKRSKIVDEHLNCIDKMYPDFLPRVNQFYSTNPLQSIHDYIMCRIRGAK